MPAKAQRSSTKRDSAATTQAPAAKRAREASPAPAESVSAQGRGARGRGRGRGRSGRGGKAPADSGVEEAEFQISSDADLGIVRADEVKSMLARENAKIGDTARGMVLFHERSFDAAHIMLDPRGRRASPSEIAETNTSPLAMLYLLLEAEDEQVEFELQPAGGAKRLSKGGEALVPPGMKYALRNYSSTQSALLMAVVPLAPDA